MSETIGKADLDALGQPGDDSFPQLNDLLQSLADDLRRLSDTIGHYYFSHADVRVS
jgi:hypothetical protein